MSLLSVLTLALLWLDVTAQAAGRNGYCTSFSKVHAVKSIVKSGGVVQCRLQDIKEGCSFNAVVLKWKHRRVCVNPTPNKMQKLLAVLCSNRKPHEAERNLRRLQRRKTRDHPHHKL